MDSTEPMLARKAPDTQHDEIMHDEAWALEPKVDGERRLIVVSDGQVHPYNHDGEPTFLPRQITRAFKDFIGPATLMFDGELLRDTFIMFDLVQAGDLVTENTPWHERRQHLEAVHGAWRPGDAVRLMPAARTEADKHALRKAIIDGHGEGLMAKLASSAYAFGKRRRDWLKIKTTHTIDCVVTDIFVDGKENMELSLYDGRRLVKVAETGLTGDGKAVVALFDKMRRWKRPPRIVVETTILYASDNNRLVQCTLPRIRTDRRPTSCKLSQLDDMRTDKGLVLSLTEKP